MDNRTYWAKRSQVREAKAYSNCLEATRGLVNAYRQTAANIRREINDFYGRFARENKLEYTDAVRLLNNNEMLEWKATVADYIEEIRREKNPEVRERLMREYDARAYGARITRLESLNGSIDNELSKLYARANEQFRELLGENYTDGYYRTIFDIQNRFGYSSMFATVNAEVVENALSYPWSGANFSDRLWKHKVELLNNLRETLTTGFIRGDSVQTMAKRLAERLDASRSNALRLIRTESSHIHNTAELDAYNECGFDEYEFMASLGERTCEVCGGMDSKRIKLADKQFGVNFPPLHPNCRCTTIAFDPDDDLSDFKAGELEYEQWYAKYVEGREQPKLESKGGAEVEVPSGKPVSPAPAAANSVAPVETPTDVRSKYSELKKRYSDEAITAERLKEEYKQLEAKVYFGDGGTDEEIKHLRQLHDEMKNAEARAIDVKVELLDAQKEYADAASKRLVDDGIFEQVKLPKTITPEAVDEIESKLRELYSDYGIMPKKMVYDPMKTGSTLASYRWNEETLYLGNGALDVERYAEHHRKAVEAFNTRQQKLRELYEKQLSEAEKILSDKSVKGYERHKAQLQKDQALVQLNQVRNVVSENIGEVIEHEYGHFLHDTANRMSGIYDQKKIIGLKQLHGEPNIWSSNNKSGQVAAANISQYATENPLEAIAEAFVAKRKGYAVPEVFDDILKDIDNIVGKSIDKSVKSGIMNNTKVVIHPDKINRFCLKPEAKHADDFFNVGYTIKDYDLLYNDIVANFDENSIVDVVVSDSGAVKFSVFMDLGVGTKKRFRTVWQKDTAESAPRFITAHRED